MGKIISQIEQHGFTKVVFEDIRPIVDRSYEAKDYVLSEFEEYCLSIFKWVMRIRECFETLEHARAYLSHFRTCEWYKGAGIGRSHYIKYHYFNYAITVVKTMDVALILTDKTFRLGNPEKLCRMEPISENLWVRSAGVNKLLQDLDYVVNPWREPRNLFVHRGETIDSREMYLLEAFDLLMESDELPIEDMPSHAKNLHYSEVSRLSGGFKETEKSLFNAISELFAGLLPIYKFWRNLLEQPPKV